MLQTRVRRVGIGFQRGTHTNWQLVTNDAAGSPTLTNLGASFPINTTDVLIVLPVSAISPRYIGHFGATAERHAA